MPKSKSWRAIVVLGSFAILVALFYAEENWRGKRAWDNCKRQLEAKGESLNWKDYIPAPVPSNQNFFAAPKMAEWFIKPAPGKKLTNDLLTRLNFTEFARQFPGSNAVTLIELTMLPSTRITDTSTNGPELVLRYSPFGNAFFIQDRPVITNTSFGRVNIPLIIFEDVPLTTAIENLARIANINYLMDPKIGYNGSDQDGHIKPEPVLSLSWTNITTQQALTALINKYGLRLIDKQKTNGGNIITFKDASRPAGYADNDVRDGLTAMLAKLIGTNAIGSQCPVILAKPLDHITPARIICYSESMPPSEDLIQLITEVFPNQNTRLGSPRIFVQRLGTNTFQVKIDAAYAADYLAWSDQFETDLNLVKDALKRPYARMKGDYSNPFSIPIPNFVTVRGMAQTLSQRAQAHLLLGEPEKALDDLSLVANLCRLLEARPSGKPMTMVASMINVAVMGLYTDTIRDGMRLNAWKEPQLSALQEQLRKINLPPLVIESFHEERAGVCSYMEGLLAGKPNLWQTFKAESQFAIPRGWLYQNLVKLSALDQEAIDSFDPVQNVILPEQLKKTERELEVIGSHFRPYTYFVAIVALNFSKAMQTLARNQTMVNEAQIACALDRYLLLNGKYPETLDALVPQYINALPHDIIGGEPLQYHVENDGKYVLYSVGWNGTDEGGQVAFKTDGTVDLVKGDWAWHW